MLCIASHCIAILDTNQSKPISIIESRLPLVLLECDSISRLFVDSFFSHSLKVQGEIRWCCHSIGCERLDMTRSGEGPIGRIFLNSCWLTHLYPDQRFVKPIKKLGICGHWIPQPAVVLSQNMVQSMALRYFSEYAKASSPVRTTNQDLFND